MKKQFYLKWNLKVEGIGYWYTSGGAKGSFGYFPHLKEWVEGKVYPIYPDTQVLGNLKAAAFWLTKLRPELYPVDLVTEVFGDRNVGTEEVPKPSKIFVTDLRLSDRSKWDANRFQIRPRIEVGEGRTVEKNMFVQFEMAYLEGVELEADIYLVGAFEESELARAKRLVEDSTKYIPGFGAFRSRGFGKGRVNIVESKIEENKIYGNNGDLFIVKLTSLVNFRNRQVEPGRKQLINCNPIISKDKFKAWLFKSYWERYGSWLDMPTAEKIYCSSFRPIPSDYDFITVSAPTTSLKNERGEILDLSSLHEEINENENFFATKATALPSTVFVTDELKPRTHELKIDKRVRNAMDEAFKTLSKGGVIVQEFIPAGTTYSGILKVKDNEALKERLFEIFSKDLALINGCIFRIEVRPLKPHCVEYKTGEPLLITEACHFTPQFNTINYKTSEFAKVGNRFEKPNANRVRLSTHRSYATSLNRPKRPKIVVEAGSVIYNINSLAPAYREYTLPWQGFGKHLRVDQTPAEPGAVGEQVVKVPQEVNEVANSLLSEGITRSQLGFLRGFLNENLDRSYVTQVVRDRIEKYGDKGMLGYVKLYKALGNYLEANDLVGMRHFIDELLGFLFVKLWEKRRGIKDERL